MKVVDFLSPAAVVPDLRGRSREEVVLELADAVGRSEAIDAEEVVRVLLARERLGSTGIGEGVAIPHGTLPGLRRLVAAFGRSREGVDFDAIDGKSTHLFFVLLTPENAVGLQALARVSRLVRDVEFRRSLMYAEDSDALFRVLQDEEART